MVKVDLRLALDQLAGWHVASEDLSDGSVVDERQLNTEAHDYTENQTNDKTFKDAKRLHGSFWAVEEEDHHDVQDGDGASSNQWHFRSQKVQRNCKTNDLGQLDTCKYSRS